MTSKEALEKIKNHAISDIDSIPLFAVDVCKSINKELEEAYNIVLKDLEILEIIKPMLKVEKGGTWWYLDTKHCFFENEEQIKKVKEWLENEEQKRKNGED